MYKLKVQNPCPCFIKRGLSEEMVFESKEEAKQEAMQLLETMEKTFCQKHQFSLIEEFGDQTIFIKPKR
jgi:hypothetical protein